MPTGMLTNRNHTNTIDGRKPAMVWLQPNASRAYSDDMPTMSQKPWMKNANSTALAQNSCFAFISLVYCQFSTYVIPASNLSPSKRSAFSHSPKAVLPFYFLPFYLIYNTFRPAFSRKDAGRFFAVLRLQCNPLGSRHYAKCRLSACERRHFGACFAAFRIAKGRLANRHVQFNFQQYVYCHQRYLYFATIFLL